ncbi:Carotenoid oxygenase [Cordyceps fumosorosea ARSEF 2679]|uniref:Carotenoid oxygenase n=1 Tax=Cordyceps fumosorosea (strain ARSEF 2679) TaxID=1081104 RepID=A0A167XJJ6_CORFA|nr:Carotenoid oxygenase [Cordyceps fumosorosea ARSEF 2679]OAA65049.1 Carotenoid oxygenase [Cordyceps fumosorosea ARSEF 2679]
MALNAPGIILRRATDEGEDVADFHNNRLQEGWKEWPNEAGFEGLEEHRGPIALKVQGSIPEWAAGSLYRTGPGQSSVETDSNGTYNISHWFDGLAHSHKFDIVPPAAPGGQTSVMYSSRRQSERLEQHIKKRGKRGSPSFGQRADPCMGIFSKAMGVFAPRDQYNNNVVLVPNFPSIDKERKPAKETGHRPDLDNLYITTDTAGLQKIDPQTLEPLGYTDQSSLHPDLKGPLSCAHAQRDPENGDLYNYNLEFGRFATYRFFRVSAATGKTDVFATVSEPGLAPAYIHSFFLTPSYMVLCIPTTHLAWNGLKILWEQSVLSSIKPFDENNQCRWLVVDRRGDRGVVARFSTPASFFFHSVNAFEEEIQDENNERRTDISLEYVRYDNTDILKSLYYDVVTDRDDAAKKFFFTDERYKKGHARLVRYRFRLPHHDTPQTKQEAETAAGEEVVSIPAPHAGDLPIINPHMAHKPHRYVYAVSSRGISSFMDCLVKTDVQTREALLWRGDKGHTPGEPIFLERPGATEEDDGVLLSVVLDGVSKTSYLLCLDARSLEELGRAEADFPIGFGFHGHHQPIKR